MSWTKAGPGCSLKIGRGYRILVFQYVEHETAPEQWRVHIEGGAMEWHLRQTFDDMRSAQRAGLKAVQFFAQGDLVQAERELNALADALIIGESA